MQLSSGCVRFAPRSGHLSAHGACPLSANSGHFTEPWNLVFGQVGRLLWPSQEEAYIPRELIRRVGVLQASTGGKHEVVVFIEVVNGAEIEPRAVVSICRVGGLMEYFPTYGKFVSHLSLEQHAREPKILVTSTAWVDPIPATGIDGPIAETLLRPDREKP